MVGLPDRYWQIVGTFPQEMKINVSEETVLKTGNTYNGYVKRLNAAIKSQLGLYHVDSILQYKTQTQMWSLVC